MILLRILAILIGCFSLKGQPIGNQPNGTCARNDWDNSEKQMPDDTWDEISEEVERDPNAPWKTPMRNTQPLYINRWNPTQEDEIFINSIQNFLEQTGIAPRYARDLALKIAYRTQEIQGQENVTAFEAQLRANLEAYHLISSVEAFGLARQHRHLGGPWTNSDITRYMERERTQHPQLHTQFEIFHKIIRRRPQAYTE